MERSLVTPTAYRVAPAGLDTRNRGRWLRLRREGIGGSDAAAILGLDPRHTAWQLWLDKTWQLPDEELSAEQAEWIEFGHAMEGVIARIWSRRQQIPGRVVKAGMLAHTDRPWQIVNLDRLVTDCGAGEGPCVFEAKNRSAWVAKDWGPIGSDQVPDAAAIQVQHALMVTGLGHGHLVAAIGGNHLRWYRIDADPVLHKTLLDEESWFWHDHVLAGIQPPIDATERTGKILARLWDADPDKVITADRALVLGTVALREAKAKAQQEAEEIARLEHELQQIMGEAEVLLDPDTGQPVATWKQNGTFRGKAFGAEHPELADHYAVPATKYDLAALAQEQPEVYRQYRARTFRLSAPPKMED